MKWVAGTRARDELGLPVFKYGATAAFSVQVVDDSSYPVPTKLCFRPRSSHNGMLYGMFLPEVNYRTQAVGHNTYRSQVFVYTVDSEGGS